MKEKSKKISNASKVLIFAYNNQFFCLVVTCWKRADLLALIGDVYCIFVTLPCGILAQVCYLIVSFADLCHLFLLLQTFYEILLPPPPFV